MKLVIAIVNDDDSVEVADALLENHFSATKMASTGGFLRTGNTTFLIGVDEDKVDEVISLIKQYSSQRSQIIPNISTNSSHTVATASRHVTVGGATIFVVNIDRFEKV